MRRPDHCLVCNIDRHWTETPRLSAGPCEEAETGPLMPLHSFTLLIIDLGISPITRAKLTVYHPVLDEGD